MPEKSYFTLDEKEFNLSENNLVIADAVKPVALAGVMGGLNSEIKNTTSSVVFESAKFARDNIRKTSRTLGQRSDSSARYEKGVDYLSVEIGMARALNLIGKLGCGKIASDEYDLIDNPLQEKTINTTFDKVNGVLGIKVPSEDIVNILKRLGFKTKSKGEELSVTVPLYREDMEDYPDIAEEIIREYGYSHIKSSLLTTSAITNGGRNYEQTKVEELKNLLIGYGFNEIITYSFISEKDFEILRSLCDSLYDPLIDDLYSKNDFIEDSSVFGRFIALKEDRASFVHRLDLAAIKYAIWWIKQHPDTCYEGLRERLIAYSGVREMDEYVFSNFKRLAVYFKALKLVTGIRKSIESSQTRFVDEDKMAAMQDVLKLCRNFEVELQKSFSFLSILIDYYNHADYFTPEEWEQAFLTIEECLSDAPNRDKLVGARAFWQNHLEFYVIVSAIEAQESCRKLIHQIDLSL